MAVIHQVVNDVPPPIDLANHEIPKWLCDIIARLHAKNPDDRFQSGVEVATLLESHLLLVQGPRVDVHRPPARPRPDDTPTRLLQIGTPRGIVGGWTWLPRTVGVLAMTLLMSTCLWFITRGQAPNADVVASTEQNMLTSIPAATDGALATTFSCIVDDRDDEYHETQSDGLKQHEGWQTGSDLHAQREAYGHSYRFNNNGAMTAVSTFRDLPPGEYDVLMTWSTGSQFKSIVRINLYDDAELLRSHRLNMSVAPGDHPGSQRHEGSDWALVDSVRADSGTLRVELDARVSKRISDDGGGTIASDAVWVRARE